MELDEIQGSLFDKFDETIRLVFGDVGLNGVGVEWYVATSDIYEETTQCESLEDALEMASDLAAGFLALGYQMTGNDVDANLVEFHFGLQPGRVDEVIQIQVFGLGNDKLSGE